MTLTTIQLISVKKGFSLKTNQQTKSTASMVVALNLVTSDNLVFFRLFNLLLKMKYEY